MYQFSAWKYWLVIIVLVAGFVCALPNVFGEEPALQLAHSNRSPMDAVAQQKVLGILSAKNIAPTASYLEKDRLVLRFVSQDVQLQARDSILQSPDRREFGIALAYASKMPTFMRQIGLKPMSLGLDLRGGVHFVYEVDVRAALTQALERIERDFRTTLRDNRVPYTSVTADNAANQVRVVLREGSDAEAAAKVLRKADQDLQITTEDSAAAKVIVATLTKEQVKMRQDSAIQQNITTLRNRVEAIGVAEPIVARQGIDRILVELPGVQDPNEAIRILGATATLEFRLVDETNDAYEAQRSKRIPITSKLYKMRQGGTPILLKREVIASGDQLTDATSGFAEGQPVTNVKLNSRAAGEMLKTTQQNVGHRMGIVYIETKQLAEGELCNGTRNGTVCTDEDVINAATIRGVFSSNFQISGLATTEAKDLALLLRAGSLATPLKLIEQRTVGPSLGADNITRGWHAMVVGLVLTFVFMAIYYRAFGWVANAVLASNLVLTVGLLSILPVSLTLPGIAAVVFHLGIAVDANILIYERIREELRLENSPRAAINAGFEKAFATIADSNVTTLIAGVVLFGIGTGTIRSFAIVMTLGILTSLFTSVVGSRALVHAVWGRRTHLEKLSI